MCTVITEYLLPSIASVYVRIAHPLFCVAASQKKRHQGKSSMTYGIPRGRYPTINSDVARDRAISELRTGRRDGQLTRGPNWSALPLLITHKVIKSVTGLPHFSPNDSPHLAAQY